VDFVYWEFVLRLREVSNQGHLCEGKKYVVELAKFSITIFGGKTFKNIPKISLAIIKI